MQKIRKYLVLGLASLGAAAPAFAEGVTDPTTFVTEVTTHVGDITSALWSAAGAFIVVLVAYIAMKAIKRGIKGVS